MWLRTWLVAIVLAYAGSIPVRTGELYAQVKSMRGANPLTVQAADPELGYVSIPEARSVQRIFGKSIPVRYDELGFRVPDDHSRRAPVLPEPVLLFLGDSWTHGAACTAETSFPQVTADLLGGTDFNAGVGGYGLTQMLLWAEQLIPRFEPDYVIVQYSPFLVGRAVSRFAPSAFGKIPVPYFAETPDGIAVEPPLYETKNFDVPVWSYVGDPGVSDFLDFLLNVGIPLFTHDDRHALLLEARTLLGAARPPVGRRRPVVRIVYERIQELAEEHGGKMIILILYQGCDRLGVGAALKQVRDAIVVDSRAALCNRLPKARSMAWLGAYAHWDGDPPKVINRHPNPAAHRIIASAIAEAIRANPN